MRSDIGKREIDVSGNAEKHRVAESFAAYGWLAKELFLFLPRRPWALITIALYGLMVFAWYAAYMAKSVPYQNVALGLSWQQAHELLFWLGATLLMVPVLMLTVKGLFHIHKKVIERYRSKSKG